MDLTKPEQTPIALQSRDSEGVETGEYDLPNYINSSGPWLVLPAKASKVKFRACFIATSKQDSDMESINTLQKASRAYSPRDEETTIGKVLKQMRNDWNHSGWQYLKDTWDRFNYLPMSTFEVWRHLVRDPQALTVALFKFEMNPDFIDKLQSQLPLMWEFLPVDSWLYAKRLFVNNMDMLNIPKDTQSLLVNALINNLVKEIPSLSAGIAEYMKNEEFSSPFPTEIMHKTMETQWYQDLLREHSEDQSWPESFGQELCQICQSLTLLPFKFQVNSAYQSGVVYAPIFAAAVASGKVPNSILNQLDHNIMFDFRQLKDFDLQWFEPVFSFMVSHLNTNYK